MDRTGIDTMTKPTKPAELPDALKEDQWLDLARRHVMADWNADEPDGYLNAIKAVCADYTAQAEALRAQRAGVATPAAPAQPGQERGDLPPLPDADLRDVGTTSQEIRDFLRGYATEYARTALAARAAQQGG